MTAPSRLPLDGLRVLDLSRVLAGPLCTQYLGDMGADGIKVEAPEGGDETRNRPVLRRSPEGRRTSPGFLSVNRNKRSLALDLKAPEGRDVVLRLARRADVVVESFAPGVAAKLGIDAAALRALQPRLVYGSISGFGSVGPLAHGKGYDIILQAFSGMLEITGDPGSPPLRGVAQPLRFDGRRTPQRRPPLLGEHSVEVLREAGLDAAAITRLIERGVVPAAAPPT